MRQPDENARELGWQTISSRIAWQGRFPVFEDEIAADLDGRRHTYTYLASRARAVAVLAQDDDCRILTVREYRHPLKAIVCDLPMGSIGKNEDPPAAALRELREETGYAAHSAEPYGAIHPIPALTRLRLEFFRARGLEFVGHERDRSEILDCEWIPLDAVLSGINDGRFQAGALPLGVLLADARGQLDRGPNGG
jgi:ADP-ribose pyrophosphatase